MCSWLSAVAAVSIGAAALHAAAAPLAYPGIGRAAAPAELRAWDTDVRPDFKGLPAGSGSVAQGMALWDAKCASCHGTFGESNQSFAALVGGTTAADIQTGRSARLNDPAYPGRTTLMKLATLSSLWDYIARAMPWTAPKSLSTDEVYAVTAYLLNLGGIVADDFTLSDANIAQVQQRLPNRNGMTTAHALWPDGRHTPPDVRAPRCMTHCAPEPRVVSSIPEHARNAHGNLAEQNRLFGAPRGSGSAAATAATSAAPQDAAAALLRQHGCVACHGAASRIVGPSLRELAQRYGGRADAADALAARIRSGGSGQWGAIAMPPQTLSDTDARSIAQWLSSASPP